MMDDDEALRPLRVGPRQVVYQNRYQQVYSVRLDFPDSFKEIFVTDYGHRVGVVLEGVNGVLLVRQYRHLIDGVSWEIPGGRVDPGERIVDAAKRECLEESGIACGDLMPLLAFHPGLETLYNPTYLFHSTQFREAAEDGAPHQGEICRRSWASLNECLKMISSGKIVDSLSVIALLAYNAFARTTRE